MGNKNRRAAQANPISTQAVEAVTPQQSKAVEPGPKRNAATKVPRDDFNARCMKAGFNLYSNDPNEVKGAYAFLWDLEFLAGETHRLYLTNGGIYRQLPATSSEDIAAGNSYVKKLWLPKISLMNRNQEILNKSAAMMFAEVLLEIDFSFRRFHHPDLSFDHEKLVRLINSPLYSVVLSNIQRVTVGMDFPTGFPGNHCFFYYPEKNYGDVEALVNVLNSKLGFEGLKRFNVVISYGVQFKNALFALPFYELDYHNWDLWLCKRGDGDLEKADLATISWLDQQSSLGTPEFGQFDRFHRQPKQKKQRVVAKATKPISRKAQEIAERGAIVIR